MDNKNNQNKQEYKQELLSQKEGRENRKYKQTIRPSERGE